jgi:hypothetical protein
MISAGAGLVLLLGLSGCASTGDREAAAATAALRLLTAVQNDDGETACAALAPDTAADVARDAPCAEAVLQEDLPGPGAVVGSAVYGQWAQVRTTTDTLFLAVFGGGWRVVAAGCAPRGNRPYDCVVQGG